MLKTPIVHPELLQALAEAGHGSRVLLADANYAVTANANPAARIVFLNFTPGTIGGLEILRALVATIVVESAVYMAMEDESVPPIVEEYKALLPGVPFSGRGRFDFYDEVKSDETVLVIASAELAARANLLMTIGVFRG